MSGVAGFLHYPLIDQTADAAAVRAFVMRRRRRRRIPPSPLRASSLGRLRLPMFPRNQMHSSSLGILRFPKMYVTTLVYKEKFLHYKYRADQTFKSEIFPLSFRVAILIFGF